VLAHPKAAAVLHIVKPLRLEHLLNLFNPIRTEILRADLVIRLLDHQPQLPPRRVSRLVTASDAVEIREQDSDLRTLAACPIAVG